MRMILWALLACSIAGCGTKRNEAVCCTTEADCNALGVSNPDNYQCSDDLVCRDNQCVFDSTSCQADSDCAGEMPHCGPAGGCVQCLESSQCEEGGCDVATNLCVGCIETADCESGVCDVEVQACVQCLQSSDCSQGVCDTSTNTCIECSEGSECASGACANQQCVECVDSSQCGLQVCDVSANACVACTASSQCGSGFCDVAAGTCRGETIVPKYLPAVCATPSTLPALTLVSSSMVIATGSDAICNGGVVQQNGGPEICVVHHASISVDAASEIRSHGTRVLALVADSSLTISGVLDVSATDGRSGPGGGFVKSGNGAVGFSGGGGAGFKTAGASGGSANNGGAAQPDPSTLQILVGGTQSAGKPTTAAGGGVTLIACGGTLKVDGTIDAGGGGGAVGVYDAITNQTIGGGGGGAGGYVVLQGFNVSVTGQVFSNGGGGGGGAGGAATAGQDATRTNLPAAGGSAANGGGRGGAGGVQGVLPVVGAARTTNTSTSGGGGGSTGFLQTYTPLGTSPSLQPSAASPAFEQNKTLQTQ